MGFANQLFGKPDDIHLWQSLLQLEQELQRTPRHLFWRRQRIVKEIDRIRLRLVYFT